MGQVAVPVDLARAHKAKGDFTPISFAVPDDGGETGFFAAFKTRVPTKLPFSLDAQFDPSTAREELIENAWNRWLIERCASVVAAVAVGNLARSPLEAWRLIPLSTEQIGASTERWPGKQFGEAFDKVRGGRSSRTLDGWQVSNAPKNRLRIRTSYGVAGRQGRRGVERRERTRFRRAFATGRADGERFSTISASHKKIGFDELLKSMANGYFNVKPVEWWGRGRCESRRSPS